MSDGASPHRILARSLVFAIDSKPRQLIGTPIDNQIVCDNVRALAFYEVPKRLCLIGRMGTALFIWARLCTPQPDCSFAAQVR